MFDEKLNHSPDTPIIIPVDSIPDWRNQFLQRLSGKTGLALARQVGSSTSKDLYTDPRKRQAFLVITTLENPVIKLQVQSQIEFYARYSQDPVFTAVVVPMTARLVMQFGDRQENVGMRQDYYGRSISEFKRSGGRLSVKHIDDFVEKYRSLIQHSGYSHGDLVVSQGPAPVVQWEHVRMGNNGLRLIDYYGQNGRMTMGLQRYSPADPSYNFIRDQQPDALRSALMHFFSR